MLLKKETTSIGEWGNSLAFRVPKKILEMVAFKKNTRYEILAVEENGKRKIIIEELPNVEEKLALLTSLEGVLSDMTEIDLKEMRKERANKHWKKYESLT